RVYAALQLHERKEAADMQRRHAEHVRDLLVESEAAWRDADVAAWRQRYGRHVDDVRTALHWAMSAEGDLPLGIAITVRSAPLLFQLSPAAECVRNTGAAMQAVQKAGTVDPRMEFQLHLVVGLVLPHTHGHHPAARWSLELALAAAEERGDAGQLAHALTTN